MTRITGALALAAMLQPAGEPYSLRTARGMEPATLHRIEVLADREQPDAGKLTLAVVRLPALSPSTRPPVVYLAGGPGQSGVGAAQIDDTFAVLQRIRQSSD